METSEMKDRLLEIIKEDLPEVNAEQIDMQASWTEEYGVDSVSLVKMIVDAEQSFGVAFDDRELALNKYDNFNDFMNTIEQKLQ